MANIMARFDSNFSSYYSNLSSIRTSIVKLQNNNPNFKIAGIKIHGPKDHISIINLYKPEGRTYVSEREYLDILI